MARHRAVALQDIDPHRINAKGRRQAVAQMHVGGGKAHGPAARIAMLDARFHRPGPAQQPRRLFGPGLLQQTADQGGGNLFVAGRRHRVKGGDAEAFHLAHIGKRRQIAGALLAEFEIMAHHRAAKCPGLPASTLSTKSCGLRCAMSPSKVSANSASTPRSASSRALVRKRRQPETFRRGRKYSCGCGSKLSTASGLRRASAWILASAIRARWPRCTPSKLPIATTAPLQAPQATSSKCRKYPHSGQSLALLGLRGARTCASDSSTSLSSTLQTQSMITARPLTSRTVAVVTTLSPIRIGSLNTMLAD